MIVAPPGVPVTRKRAPSASSTIVGLIADSMRFSAATAFRSPCTSPNWFGVPGFAAKSSMVLLRKNPAPSTTTFPPNHELMLVVTATAFPSASTTE